VDYLVLFEKQTHAEWTEWTYLRKNTIMIRWLSDFWTF